MILKLNFVSPLHIGLGKPDYYSESGVVLHSDTIKSAIFATIKLLMTKEDRFLQIFGKDKQQWTEEDDKRLWESFIVSSAMPFYRDVYFLPKPNLSTLPLLIWDESQEAYLPAPDQRLRKRLKRVKFIQQSLFDQLNSGQTVKIEDYQLIGDLLWSKQTVQQIVLSDFSQTEREFFDKAPDIVRRQIIKDNLSKVTVFKKGIQERVKVNAIPELEDGKYIHSRPYTFERIYFAPDAGLYFILKIIDENVPNDLETIIESALDFLSDTGFGTDKSVGNGQFEYEKITDNFMLNQPSEASYKMNLSLFLPENIETAKQHILRYRLIQRGGYIANFLDLKYTGVMRNQVRMLDIGSVFKAEMNDSSTYVDLRPDTSVLPQHQQGLKHPVWRDGRAIFLNLNFKPVENLTV